MKHKEHKNVRFEILKFVASFVYFLICFLFNSTTYAQKQYQLNRQEKTTWTTKDTASINDLARKGYEQLTIKREADSAIFVYLQVLEQSSQTGYIKGEAKASHNLAQAYYLKSDFEKAVFYMKQAIDYFNQLNENTFRQYVSLCQFFSASNQPDSVIRSYYLAINLFDTTNKIQENLYSKLNNLMANNFFKLGHYDSALYYYYKSIQGIKQTNIDNYKYKAWAYNGIAMNMQRMGAFEKALPNYITAENIALLYKDSSLLMKYISNKASLYYDWNKTDEAKRYALQALSMAQKREDSKYIISNAYTVAALLNKEGQPEQALPYSKMAYDYGREKSYSALFILGYTYVQLQQYQKAVFYLEKALKIIQTQKKGDNIGNVYGQLSIAYAGLSQYKKAYLYRSQYSTIRDSLMGKENAAKIAKIEAQYQTARQKQELAEQKLLLQQKESRIQKKNFWIGGIISGTLLLGILFVTLYRNNNHKQKAKLLQAQKQQELDLLKARMDTEQEERNRIGRELHDGIVSQLMSIKLNVNTLQDHHPNVQQPALNHIAQQLEEATLELRTTSHNLMPEALLKAGLEKAVGSLCEQIQRFSKMEVSFQVYGPIPAMGQDKKLSLYRMVQELIQNVIKHADATQLLVQLSFCDPLLSITVEDNGVGLSEAIIKNDGIGLQNIRHRVAELHGTMDIKSNPGVETAIYLEFELPYLAAT